MAPGRIDDDLLMALVEQTLQTPSGERDSRLCSLCPDPELQDEVRSRVHWEERMGRFLLDPLFERTAPDDPFGPGSVVGGRFRILRKIGYGGMGIVFEAVDEKLERRVALKCARPGHRYRLPPEARAAREVSHPNVCRVYDLHTVPAQGGEVDFISMEFIEGQTLSERLRASGPVPDPEAREIAGQICQGLAQAHRQGVIHGDLKCSNILLATAPDGSVRAVITDFGLAKMKEPEGGVMSGQGGGTFDYMAPELLLGDRATVVSDLYALGVLFHLLVTGRSPERLRGAPSPTPSDEWRAGTRESTLTMARTAIDPAEWQRKIAALPPRWNRAVAGCLEPRPEKRFASAEAVERALQPPPSKLKWAALPAAALALAAAAYWQWGMQPAGAPVRLAMLPAVLEGSAPAALAGIGLDVAERLSGARRNFVVISPREMQVNRVDTGEKAKTVFGATHVLRTRLRGAGSQVFMEASVGDLDSGRVVASIQGPYETANAPEMAKAILAMASGAFQLHVAPRESVSGAAYVPYVQALDLMRQDASSNADKAIPLFEQAAALAPRSALPYAGLAEAQTQRYLRHDGMEWLDKAGESIVKAKSINSDSPKVLIASAFFEQQHGRYEPAIQEVNRALQLDQGNADAWRRLAGIYQSANRDEEAVATFRKAIAQQPGDYRTYVALGNFYFLRNQFRLAETEYRTGAALAPGVASGHMNIGIALARQGRYPEAEQELLRAIELRKTPLLLMNTGGLYYAWERYADAASYFEQSIAAGTVSSPQYRDLGDAYRHLGRTAEAKQAYTKAMEIAEDEVTRNPRNAAFRMRLGVVAAFLGDVRRANFEVSQALGSEPGNAGVIREAVVAYETLHERDKSLEALRNAPAQLFEELNRFPDVKDLQQDPRFQELFQQRRK
jgi:tetratricopeptide (TPR) repeat protein